MSLRTAISTLIFCLDDVFVDVSVVKFPTIYIVLLSVSLLFLLVCFIYSGAPLLVA